MKIKQIAVFMENKPGRISNITRLLSENKIDIRAINTADTTEFGILRMIVADTDKAENVLRNEGMSVSITEVIAVMIDDKIGALSDMISILKESNVNIEYLYSFIGEKSRAVIVLKNDNNDKCVQVLSDNNIKILSENDLRGVDDAE